MSERYFSKLKVVDVVTVHSRSLVSHQIKGGNGFHMLFKKASILEKSRSILESSTPKDILCLFPFFCFFFIKQESLHGRSWETLIHGGKRGAHKFAKEG